MKISLANRLVTYILLFSNRNDVDALETEMDWAPDGSAPGYKGQVDPAVSAFYAGLDTLDFVWAFKNKSDEVSALAAGACGGRLNILAPEDGDAVMTPAAEWYLEDDELHAVSKFEEQYTDERMVFLTQTEGEPTSVASLYNWDQNAQAGFHFGDLETFITAGAKRGFIFQWHDFWPGDMRQEQEEALASLRTASVPELTLAELTSRIAAEDDLSAIAPAPELAAAMLEWLGEDAVLLVTAN